MRSEEGASFATALTGASGAAASPLFEIALVLARCDHVASRSEIGFAAIAKQK
jgi:hypothetical protein